MVKVVVLNYNRGGMSLYTWYLNGNGKKNVNCVLQTEDLLKSQIETLVERWCMDFKHSFQSLSF